MKKQNAFAPKLAFNKEKIALLTPDDLDQIHGGLADTDASSHNSTNHNFTCCLCSFHASIDIPVSE